MEALAVEKLDTMEGTVRYVPWDDNGFTVITFKSGWVPDFAVNPKYPKSFTAVGTFAMKPYIGQRYELKGCWEKTKYGWQFKVKSYTELDPLSEKDIVEYLSSGLFKGIGKKTAQAIVDVFGMDTLQIIKNSPQRLKEVKGIHIKVEDIVKDYEEMKQKEKLILSLKPYRISFKTINKIYELYKEKAMEVIIDNPYRLCDEIEGIGFKTADLIGNVCNIDPNDEYRIRAGIKYTLTQAASFEGHVYLPFELMVKKVQDAIQKCEVIGPVDQNHIARVAVDMHRTGDLIIEKDDSVFLPIYYASEVTIGNKISGLLKTKPRDFADIENAISLMESKFDIKYAEKQKEAFHMLAENNLMIITGSPGTGKTTIIKGIIEIFKHNYKNCQIILAAPTGRAAKRMEEATGLTAKTLHRTLEYRPTEEGVCSRNEKNPLDADLIIVDESSMKDTLLTATFLKAVKNSTSVIFVGDVDQLPSVGAGNVLKDLIDSKKVPTIYLNEIFRQKDTSKIVINAAKINAQDTDLEYGDDFILIEEDNLSKLPELIVRHFKEELAEIKDINQVQVITPMRKITYETGSTKLNSALQEDLNPKKDNKPEVRISEHRVFRKYDKVMQTKNDAEKEVYNGDNGIVYDITTNMGSTTTKIKFSDTEHSYARNDLDEVELAYACTVHKSQGCEYDVVIIPLDPTHKRMLQKNLIYTAVTRAKKKVILIGKKEALIMAIKNSRVSTRFTKLKERL